MDNMNIEEVCFVYETPKVVVINEGVRLHIRSLPYATTLAWKFGRIRNLARFWRDTLIHPERALMVAKCREIVPSQEIIQVAPGEKVSLRCRVGFACRVFGLHSTGFYKTELLARDLRIGGGCGLLCYEEWVSLAGVSSSYSYMTDGNLRDRPLLFSPNEASIELWNAGGTPVSGRVYLLVERMSEKLLEEERERRNREAASMVGLSYPGSVGGAMP